MSILLTDGEVFDAINAGRKGNKMDSRNGMLRGMSAKDMKDYHYTLKGQLDKIKNDPELKEKIARKVAVIRGLLPWHELPDNMVETQFNCTLINGHASKQGCYKYADSILAFLGGE